MTMWINLLNVLKEIPSVYIYIYMYINRILLHTSLSKLFNMKVLVLTLSLAVFAIMVDGLLRSGMLHFLLPI